MITVGGEIMINPNEMTKEQLHRLRSDICLGSLFISDYENRYDLDPKVVCAFFDGYCDYIGELMEEEGISDDAYWDMIERFDNDDTLEDWYYMCELPFGEEPFGAE